MKYKFKNEQDDVIIGTFDGYINYDQEISEFDKKFIQDFNYFNNFDGDHDSIEIITNETELSFFVLHVINEYKKYLNRRIKTVTKNK